VALLEDFEAFLVNGGDGYVTKVRAMPANTAAR
jgi:hypothetical protein